jgi:hypothetical protein
MRENIKITENGEENPSVETLVALTREMIDGIPEVIIRHVEKSVMSSSTYFSISRADGKPWHLTKSQSRRYFTEFPKANGITAFGNFEIRISDHRAVSCRSAPNASVRSIADIAVVARQIKFFLSFP